MLALCEKFIREQEISCPECVCQCDWVITNAYEFIENICTIVGYYNSETDSIELPEEKK